MILSSLGQDGLVANTLKYLDGQHVIGLNPDPKRWDGVPLPFGVADLAGIVAEEIRGRRPVKSVTMAKATLNTGTELYAVNDLFIGPRSHISAPICFVGRRQGGAPILERHHRLDGPRLYRLAEKHLCGLARDDRSLTTTAMEGAAEGAFAWDAAHLHYVVREPFPSRTTGASLVIGRINRDHPMTIVSEMPEHGVIFSDGLEADFSNSTVARR